MQIKSARKKQVLSEALDAMADMAKQLQTKGGEHE